MAPAERLAQVDEELGALGKGDEEVVGVRARIAAEGVGSLEAVDAALAELAAALEGSKELLERAAEKVPAVVGTFTKGAAAAAAAEASAEEDLFNEAPWGPGGADPEQGGDRLSADELFSGADVDGGPDAPLTADPALSEPPPAASTDEGGADVGGGLADLLEGEEAPAPAATDAAPDTGVDTNLDFSESTDMMSADEVEAIRASVPPGQEDGEEMELEVEVLDDDDFELLVEEDDLG
ncbi:MAG: hypothetical protein ACODAU_10010 [Myxococcota bacterium]